MLSSLVAPAIQGDGLHAGPDGVVTATAARRSACAHGPVRRVSTGVDEAGEP